jgi:hypothetical protein
LLWPLAAAAILLVGGLGTVAGAAVGAHPGQLLYGVHRLEQGAWADVANSPDERVQLHLRYSQEALDAFDAAVAHHADASTIRDALTTFEQEEQAAATEIAALPASDDRTALIGELGALRTCGQQQLHAALPALDWLLRADVTSALGQLGADVLHLTHASITGTSHDGLYIWIVTITGSGFAPGAILLIDDRPMGTVDSWSPTTLVAQIPGDQLGTGLHAVGIGNPDGTASLVTSVASSGGREGHGGSGGSGGGGNGSGDGTHTPWEFKWVQQGERFEWRRWF